MSQTDQPQQPQGAPDGSSRPSAIGGPADGGQGEYVPAEEAEDAASPAAGAGAPADEPALEGDEAAPAGPTEDEGQPAEDEDRPADSPPPCSGPEAETAATVEAILFAADKPLPAARVSEIGQLGGVRNVRRAVAALNARYEAMGGSFRIVAIAGGYQMQTLPQYADVLERLHTSRVESRLSQAALETVAVVAYRQPVLRADIEAIRGVACGELLRGLLERNLVRIVGRAEELGRPMLYGTTRHFLEVFGLAGLEDLPNAEQLRMPADAPARPTRQPPDADGKPLPAGEAQPPEGPPPPGQPAAPSGQPAPPQETGPTSNQARPSERA